MLRLLVPFAFLLFSLSPIQLVGQDRALNTVEVELQRLIQHPALKHGQVGFAAINLDNGKVIAEHNSYRAMIPASIQKLITTSTSLDGYGPAHQFKTIFGHTGSIDDGVLNGNLVIIGSGDPTFGSRHFNGEEDWKKLIASLKAKGIDSINGRILVHASVYTEHTTPDASSWEDMGNYFGATPTALMFRDNSISLALRSGQEGSDVALADPWPSFFPFTVDLDVKAGGTKDDAWFFSAPGSGVIYGKGTIPPHESRFIVKIANPDPMRSFCFELAQTLGWGAVDVRIERDLVEAPNIQGIDTFASPKLSDLISITNHKSVNLFAEALNLANDTALHHRSVEGGAQSALHYLKKLKVNASGLRLLDGSGVSPMNRTTPQTMVEFLGAQYRSESFEFFRSSLPTGGETGTVKYYFKEGKAKGNLLAKSGTMKGVRNYAGYVKNKYDENVAFCIMMNDYDESRKTAVMKQVERIIEAVIED